MSYIDDALALYDKLINPENNGFAGTILLTKLKRALKKVSPNGELPEQLSHITNDRLNEFRQSNLISSADKAFQKAKNPDLAVSMRIKQIRHAVHYIEKAQCGWQVLGLSEVDFIRHEFDLFCEDMLGGKSDQNTIDRKQENIEEYLKDKKRAGILDEEAYFQFVEELLSHQERAAQNSRALSIVALNDFIAKVDSGALLGSDAEQVFNDIGTAARGCGAHDDEFKDIYQRAEGKNNQQVIAHFDQEYLTLKEKTVGLATIEGLEVIEKELSDRGLELDDLNADDKDAVLDKAVAEYINDTVTQAKALAAEKNYSEAYQLLEHAKWYWPERELDDIEITPDEFMSFRLKYLKGKLEKEFNDVVEGNDPANQKLRSLNQIEEALYSAHNNLKWEDIDVSAEQLRAVRQPLHLQMADEYFARYKETGSLHDLWPVADSLGRAHAGWDDLKANKQELDSMFQEHGDDLPGINHSAY